MNRAEFAGVKTLAALQTLRNIDSIRRSFFIRILRCVFDGDTVGGAFFRAGAAADTFYRIDFETYQFLALARTALFIVYVFGVLFVEIF